MSDSRHEHGLVEALFASDELGLALIDSKLRYVRVNDALGRINGVEPEAHVGRTVREILADFAGPLESVLRQVLEARRPVIGLEVSGPIPADPEADRDFRVSFFPILEDDQAIGVAAFLVEITEAARSQRQLIRQAQDIYEKVVQDLTVVRLALEKGNVGVADEAAARALDASKAISSKVLLEELEADG